MQLYLITERSTPRCDDENCDPCENPAHWVDIELSREFITTLETALEAMDGACDCGECGGCEAAAKLREAIERGQKPG